MQEHIKITAAAPRIQYVGDGAQREFFFPFAIFKTEHVEVFLDGERLTSGVTVLGAGESAGGSVILDPAPGEGVLVTVRRRIAVERTTDFQPAGAFSARLINDEFDYLTAALQQVAADTETSLRIAATEPVVDMTLPAVPGRSGRVLAFDGGGRPRPESRDEVAASLGHGKLRGLDGDDHPHYLTAPRADAWMGTKSLDDLRDGFIAKRYTAQEKGKLAAIPGNAEVNPPRVSEAEKLSGSEWEPRTFSPRDVVDLVHRFVPPAGTSGGSTVSAHAMLVGLSADDHLHYLTHERADGWLAGKTADALAEGEANRYMRLADNGTAETAARSDHTHAGVYEPAFAKNTAFNRNFGTAATEVAAGNHTHDAAAIASGTLVRARLPLLTGDAGSGGSAGAVPAPAAGDAAAGKFLAADATWRVPSGGTGGSGVPKGTSFPAYPAGGDAFYRTDLSSLFFYDGVRGKWLGELESDGAGWNGSHNNDYLGRFTGAMMSASVGILVPYDITVVGISMVWDTTVVKTNLNIVRNGVILYALTMATAGTSTSSMALNVDFAAGGILAFSTSSHVSALPSPQLRCWWRRRAT